LFVKGELRSCDLLREQGVRQGVDLAAVEELVMLEHAEDGVNQVAPTTAFVVRVSSLIIIPAVSSSNAVSKLRRTFLSN
jgi:hypothetical protein